MIKVGLGVAAFGGLAAAASALSAPTPTVTCDKIVGSAAEAEPGGYRIVLGVVSAPPAHLPQVVRAGTRHWPYVRKAGIRVRGGSLPVYVTVPRAWRDRVAVSWGNSGTTSTLRIARCPPSEDAKPWNAYSGGFLLRTRAACVPLLFQVGNRRATVRFGLGRHCG